MSWRLTALATACALCSACGGSKQVTAFANEWEDDRGASITAVQTELRDEKPPVGPAIAVGVTDTGLVATGLDGKSSWTYAAQLDARPAIAGDVVVGTGAGQLFALDAASGKPLWKISSEGRSLRGAGDDGTTTVVSLGSPAGGGSLFLAVERSGSIRAKLTPQPEIGDPAVLGSTAFIPWGNQYVSAIDLDTEREVGRVVARTQVSHAIAIGGQLYFGQDELIAFDDAIGGASQNQAHRLGLPQRELPGRPRWLRSGSQVWPVNAGARDRIQLYARPVAENGTLGLESNQFSATYFRIAVGLSGDGGALAWVRTFDHELVGGTAARGGFAFCDTQGTVWLTSAAGGPAGKVELGQPITTCVAQGGDFTITGAAAPQSLTEQIAEAVRLRETDMVTIQRFLLRELATHPDEQVTKILLELASDARTPPPLASDVEKLLASRRTGAKYMLEALGRSYDFLDDVLRPPPVGPLADALAAMGERRAAPLLAKQLNEPANSSEDVARAAKALVTLATQDELDDIQTFFTLYRATATDKNLVSAVISAARILVKLGGEEQKELVQFAARDPLTQPGVKKGIGSLVPKAG